MAQARRQTAPWGTRPDVGGDPTFRSEAPTRPGSGERPRARPHRQSLDFDEALDSLAAATSSPRTPEVKAQQRRYRVLEPISPTQRQNHTGRLVAEFHTMDLALQFARDQLEHGREVTIIDTRRGKPLPLLALLHFELGEPVRPNPKKIARHQR